MIFGKGRNLEGWGIFFILANWPIFFPASSLPRYSAALRLPRCCASLRLPTLGYTFDFPFYHGAIARVFAPAHVALRAAFGRQCWFASPRDVSPFGLLMQPTAQPPCCLVPSQRPLACVPVSSFRFPVYAPLVFRGQNSAFNPPPPCSPCPRWLNPSTQKLAKWPGCQNRNWD